MSLLPGLLLCFAAIAVAVASMQKKKTLEGLPTSQRPLQYVAVFVLVVLGAFLLWRALNAS